ncbi:trehalose-phosphatase [Microbacterium horticulturae]|uniref:Trehalose 6-phosphate phosphatase n=1 Tax=Microbacterium horticulturae TaxID=3028316 RepID=A0ABY8BTE3_9MICO|nr:trehalose-phosphatase [Microbacterium sp. KACC 23027]WEG07434.1 trehalose-phosphatase [Microbacterium sp. KACC 23027]
MTADNVAVGRLARAERLLVALDFDGTLSPLEDDPMAARMLPAARTAVEALAALPHTWAALVSGRSLSDLRTIAEHDDDSPILLAGSHGAEYWTPDAGTVEPADDPADVALRDRLRGEAERATGTLPGVWIEPKTFGFGVHTRTAAPADAAKANTAVDEIVSAAAPHWRRRTGHNIVEYAFRDEGKDTAVAHLRELTRADAVLFAGDDVTDEDALRSLGEGDVGVHVGEGASTAATLVVADIPAFAALLARLAEERRSPAE